MSAAAFCLLVLNVLGTPKPKFAQLASSVFGLFYCGTRPRDV
jgi:phosphatidate cytidylyltransferase